MLILMDYLLNFGLQTGLTAMDVADAVGNRQECLFILESYGGKRGVQLNMDLPREVLTGLVLNLN